MAITIFGIKNCDTMKKARAWLDARGAQYVFHDYKTAGIDAGHLERWCRTAGWETVLNRTGTTFRQLPEADRVDLDYRKALRLMLARPSMIKRPVLEIDDRVLIGFDPAAYEQNVAHGAGSA